MTTRRRSPDQSHSVLLLPDPLLDQRIWAPLTAVLEPGIDVRPAMVPASAAMFTARDWAAHVERCLLAGDPGLHVDLVVADGQSAEAGLRLASRGSAARVLLWNPPLATVFGRLDDEAQTRMREVLSRPEAVERLEPIVSALTDADREEFLATGRMRPEAVSALVEGMVAAEHGRDPGLLELLRIVSADRFTAALPVDLAAAMNRRDASRDLALLGDRVAIGLPEGSAVDQLGLRDRLEETVPLARVYPVPLPARMAPWWEDGEAFAAVIRSVLDGSGPKEPQSSSAP